MKIKAIIFASNDDRKLDFTLKHFKYRNPHIPVLIYNNGSTDMKPIANKYGYEYKKVPNIWHKKTHCGIGSFDYKWFEYMFEFGLKDDEYTHVLFLETDIYTIKPITKIPEYDMSGPLFFSSEQENILYNYFDIKKYGYEFNQMYNRMAFPHTGCGGTIYSKEFFIKSQKNLPFVKKVYAEKIENCYMDLIMTYLAIISNCSFGNWKDSTNICGDYRLNKNKLYKLSKTNWGAALIHKVKYKNNIKLIFDILISVIGYKVIIYKIYFKLKFVIFNDFLDKNKN